MNVIDLRYLDGFRLQLEFSDGTSGAADLSREVETFKAFAPLRNVETFRKAFIEGGTVAWPGGLDLAVEHLYALAHRLPVPRTLEEAQCIEHAVRLRKK